MTQNWPGAPSLAEWTREALALYFWPLRMAANAASSLGTRLLGTIQQRNADDRLQSVPVASDLTEVGLSLTDEPHRESTTSEESNELAFSEALIKRLVADRAFRFADKMRVAQGENSEDAVALFAASVARDLAQHLTEVAVTLRSTEDLLRQSQKLEAVGRLAGGIAHDFNNLLTAIRASAEFIREGLTKNDPIQVDVSEIIDASRRAATLTHQLLAFSSKQFLQPRVFDINAVVTDLNRMLRRLIGDNIAMDLQIDPDAGAIDADPGQIEQVLVNLVVNARDALPDGGRITIETSRVDIAGAIVDKPGHPEPGSYVRLTVSDDGVGMTAEVQRRIFEPFYSTKAPDKGTGLGLATVYGIVKQSGGRIVVYSEPGHGSAFKIYFPRAFSVADIPLTAPRQPTKGGSESILIVDDEPPIVRVASRILSNAGYSVSVARDGAEAMGLLADPRNHFALVLSDIVMPRLSGGQLARHIIAERPEIKVILISGYTDSAVDKQGLAPSNVPFMQKPFNSDALLRKVREVLDHRPTPFKKTKKA